MKVSPTLLISPLLSSAPLEGSAGGDRGTKINLPQNYLLNLIPEGCCKAMYVVAFNLLFQCSLNGNQIKVTC